MIVVRAPTRVSLFGGGSDVPALCDNGAVFSMAIDKYVYVMLKDRFGGGIRISYSKTENVSHINEIQNELIRESLRYAGFKHTPASGLELVTMSDVPSAGSGLGASSSLVVAILAACDMYHGRAPHNLAERACKIEIDILGKPIGKQDQYAAALGGVCLHNFGRSVVSQQLTSERMVAWNAYIMPRMLMLYLGPREQYTANQILDAATRHQVADIMAEQARDAYKMAMHASPWDLIDYIGGELRRAWDMKRQLTPLATNPEIDRLCTLACDVGAAGVKLLGAGAGGCLLIFAEPELHPNIKDALGLKQIPFSVDPYGAMEVAR